jgi:hypothetical protein
MKSVQAVKSVQHKIKEDLKRQFPRQKFNVDVLNEKSANPKLHIQWTNGPAAEKVDEVCRKHSSEVAGVDVSRRMTYAARALALSILVENNRKTELLTKTGKVNLSLPKEELARLSAGKYTLTEPASIDDAIIQIFNQMSL